MKKESSRWSEADYEAFLQRTSKKSRVAEMQQSPVVPSARYFSVKLPIPPPVTQVYANSKVGGRSLTPIAKQWKFNAGCLIKLAAQRQQWWYYPGARLYLSIVWHFASESSDIDNPIKILQDTLATTLLFNDKVIDAEDVLRGEDCPEEPHAEVELGFKDETYQTRKELTEERDRLRDAIVTHRAQKADDRCIEDDDRLYEALGDGIKCDRRVGDKQVMLANCARFIERRCEAGGWPNYIELEQRLARVRAYAEGLPEGHRALMLALIGEEK